MGCCTATSTVRESGGPHDNRSAARDSATGADENRCCARGKLDIRIRIRHDSRDAVMRGVGLTLRGVVRS
jgi:hypothetical protein